MVRQALIDLVCNLLFGLFKMFGMGLTPVRKSAENSGASSDTNVIWQASVWNGNSPARRPIPAHIAAIQLAPIGPLSTWIKSSIGALGSPAPSVAGVGQETMPPHSTSRAWAPPSLRITLPPPDITTLPLLTKQ